MSELTCPNCGKESCVIEWKALPKQAFVLLCPECKNSFDCNQVRYEYLWVDYTEARENLATDALISASIASVNLPEPTEEEIEDFLSKPPELDEEEEKALKRLKNPTELKGDDYV